MLFHYTLTTRCQGVSVGFIRSDNSIVIDMPTPHFRFMIQVVEYSWYLQISWFSSPVQRHWTVGHVQKEAYIDYFMFLGA